MADVSSGLLTLTRKTLEITRNGPGHHHLSRCSGGAHLHTQQGVRWQAQTQSHPCVRRRRRRSSPFQLPLITTFHSIVPTECGACARACSLIPPDYPCRALCGLCCHFQTRCRTLPFRYLTPAVDLSQRV